MEKLIVVATECSKSVFISIVGKASRKETTRVFLNSNNSEWVLSSFRNSHFNII